ncbi:MAG: gliding motility-associated C-terminal domain-containing protein [Saprospiraceae bacterium]|nr:gliding motility-associated C-terminal domain-containing protein [Saprospiraceae bacterium]
MDFNVWGPFTQDQVCESKDQVIAFIRNNQPIRSSWSPTPGVTGLADRHPIFNTPVTDEYDCGDEPGADGDDFVSTIPTLKGEVYVVLINDWGNLIGEEGVGISWSPSAPAVLEQLPSVVEAGDTSICLGESVQLEISSPVSSIIWLNDTTTLSCDDCPNPIATPTQTTTYRALVDAVCYNDTIDIKVEVFSVNAGPDVTVCRGEKFDIIAGSSFDDAIWQWNVPAGIEFSCLDCPNPTVSANTPGTYQITVSLTAPDCTPRDTVVITVRPEEAPEYSISDDLEICQGESVNLGGAPNANIIYEWTSIPEGFTSTDANPAATPLQTTKYFLSVSSPICPITKLDSVSVTVFIPPVLEVVADTSVCQEQPVQLGLSQPESGVTYSLVGPDIIDDPANLNTLTFPTSAGNYIITATRGACEVMDTVQIGITPIDIAIQVEGQEPDTVRLCRGEELNLSALAVPSGTPVIWAPNDGSLSDTIGTNIIAKPETQTTYYATVTVGECIRVDSIIVIVDSLPSNLAIMPGDTSICEGSLIILESELFEPKDFMEIEFKWLPNRGQQTPDSLYNLVIQPDTTTQYYRITTNGVCVDTAYANVEVKPIPQLQIIPSDTTVCPGERVQYRVEGPDGLTKPMWMPPTGLSCTECFNPTATAFTSVSYQFMAELDGCPGSASASLNVPVPQISLNPRTEICLGETIRLNFANTPGATYTWTSSSDPNFMSNDPLLTVTPTQNTTYKVVAQVEGCEPIEASISIIVVQDADVNVPDNQTICEGSSITLTADGTAPNGVTETFLWRWNGQTMANPTVTVNNLTDDTVFELIYTYGRNCGVVTKTVLVEVAPAPVLELNPDRVICAGETIQLNLNASNSPEVIYTWTSPGNPNFTSNNPLLSVSPTQTTTYRVKAESQGCGTLEQEITITVVSAAEVNITGNTSICRGETLSLMANSNLPAGISESYVWTGNGQQFTGKNLTINNLTQNTQFVLVYTYGDCGEVVKTVDVVVNQAIQVDSISISPDPNNLFLGQTLTITANTTPATPAGATFAWTANGESISGNTPQISHTPDESPVTYEVTITSATGCTTTTAVTVTLNEPVVDVPNAFTPNGDGRNDFFNVISKTPFTILEFKVYNRWGQLVYDNGNPSQGWDGKHNGNDAPSDVYVYYIRVRFLTNREEVLRGDVTLIR